MGVREAEPVGSLQEVKEAGLDREDLLGIYRNMLITRGIEERGHILYKQGKIPGSFYTGRGNEAAAVGVATAMGAARRRHAAPPRHGRARHARRRAVAHLRPVHGPRGRTDEGRDGNVHLGRREPRHCTRWSATCRRCSRSRSGMALAFRIRGEQRVAVGWFGEGASARGDAHEAMNFAGVRQLPVVFVCDNNQWAYSTPTYLEYAVRAHRRPRRRVRIRGRRRRRNRRARRLPRGEARDREGARGRRPDAARVPDAAHGGPRGPRRRLLRPEGDVRGVGANGPDRALPQVAARERGAHRRRGRRDHVRTSSGCFNDAVERADELAAPRSRPRSSTASSHRPRSSTRRTTSESRWPRRPTSRRSRTGSARRCDAIRASSSSARTSASTAAPSR